MVQDTTNLMQEAVSIAGVNVFDNVSAQNLIDCCWPKG
jgi:hypothetical protein